MEPPAFLAPPAAADHALELIGVDKRYRATAALHGVDLAVPRGAVVGLVGPSGAGKTTALRVGLGLARPDRGEARVFGRRAAGASRHSGRIGLVLEGPALERGLTVLENLELHALRHGRALPDPRPLLERFELAPLAKRRTVRLSQGEAARVAIVRTLLFAPDLIVLDEPTAHLDPALARTALDTMREAAGARGAAVLVSSHQLAELERVITHVVLLHQGRVRLAGELSTLLGGLGRVVRIAARPLERARATLERHPDVAGLETIRAEGTDVLRAELRGDAAASVNAALHSAGVEVSQIAPERPSLEELFRRTLIGAAA